MKDYGGSEDVLLGELQFAFIAFLVYLDLYKTFFMLKLLFGFMTSENSADGTIT